MTTKFSLFVGIGTAVTVTSVMWIAGGDWLTTFATAALTCVALPHMLVTQRDSRL